ncbi:Zn-dependent protease (includes SpoIVFB) [Bryocella elongata]|uniref:Zn-dependent protease (Includes SpoIVFB) n=1 Tax=Bryocella elongata TaxID=863522 RepID=A0A1H6BPM7_9BACT|nr:site-2 protease family protein [Bryocella elongata]SEG62669.1 Zn-dependent protease (includes SpoIVFB) [Bryocella elongata]
MPQSPVALAIIVFTLVMMVFSISLHDMTQAWMANRLGDPTARMMGRITMNPMAHFDAWGMGLSPLLSIFIFHNRLPLGWGKPVPTTYRNFHSKNGEMLAVLAGPCAQFVAAVVSLIVMVVLKHHAEGGIISLQVAQILGKGVSVDALPPLPGIFPVMLLLYLSITMNLMLLCLNILPFPFFDGGRLLLHFLPYNAAKKYEELGMWMLVGFFLLAGPMISIIFSPLIGVFDGLLSWL